MKKITLSSKTVICGYPGIGKSYMRERNPLRVSDLDSGSYAWLSPSVRDPKFPQNYVDLVRRSNNIVLVSSHKDVRESLANNRINFLVCYPKLSCKWTYLERYRQQHQSEAFIRLMDIMWMEWVNQVKNDIRATQHIELPAGKFLSDVIDFG